MATRTKFVPGHPETHCLDGITWGHMEDDYAPNDADREWVARELGDVEHEPPAAYGLSSAIFSASEISALDCILGGNGVIKVCGNGDVLALDPYSLRIPEESLGRSHE